MNIFKRIKEFVSEVESEDSTYHKGSHIIIPYADAKEIDSESEWISVDDRMTVTETRGFILNNFKDIQSLMISQSQKDLRRLVCEKRAVDSHGVSISLGISVQSASARLKTLLDLGYLRRNQLKDSTGGIFYEYCVADHTIPDTSTDMVAQLEEKENEIRNLNDVIIKQRRIAVDIGWDASRKNRACDNKEYLIGDLDRIDAQVNTLMKLGEVK